MAKSNNRLASLDIFRGMTVALMIIVNTPGSREYVYSPLRHSEWHGCTPADLVFPFFIFIVGVSMWFSLKKYGHELNGGSLLRIIRRTLSIFLLGIFLAVFPYFDRDYSTLRIMGVLQRIALVYGVGALLCLTVRREYLWIVAAVLLLLYWGLLAFFGGSDPYSLEGNFAQKADALLLGTDHLYRGFGRPFDPEGLLSTMPAVATVIIGFYAGGLLGKGSANLNKVLKMLLIGIAATGLGILWGKLFPINKPLWTSSYTIYSAGIAMALLALLYMVADLYKLTAWGFLFAVFGANALFSYFLSGISTRLLLFIKVFDGEEKITLYRWIYEKICFPVAGSFNGSLMFALIQLAVIWIAAFFLFRKKIMLRL